MIVSLSDCKTLVFWDVDDYPVPNDVDVGSLRSHIESNLRKLGCGEVTIVAYVYKNTFSDELERRFTDAQIYVDYLPEGDDNARITWMLVDIVCFIVLNPESNVVVLSKHLNEEAVDALEVLYGQGVGVLLSRTEPGWLVPDENSALFLTSLFEQRLDDDEKKPQSEAISVDDSVNEDNLCSRLQRKANVSS